MAQQVCSGQMVQISIERERIQSPFILFKVQSEKSNRSESRCL